MALLVIAAGTGQPPGEVADHAAQLGGLRVQFGEVAGLAGVEAAEVLATGGEPVQGRSERVGGHGRRQGKEESSSLAAGPGGGQTGRGSGSSHRSGSISGAASSGTGRLPDAQAGVWRRVRR